MVDDVTDVAAPDATTAVAVPTQTPTQATAAGTAARLGERPGARPAIPSPRAAAPSVPVRPDPVTVAAPPASAAAPSQNAPAQGAAAQPAPKMPTWDQVASTPSYQSWSPEEKSKAKIDYFKTAIAPNLKPGADGKDVTDKAYQQFMAYHPEEVGFREAFKRSLYGGAEQFAGDVNTAAGAVTSAAVDPHGPSLLPEDDQSIAAHYKDATGKVPTPDQIASTKASNKSANAARKQSYNDDLQFSDDLFAKGDKQIEDAKKYETLPGEKQTFGGVIGSILGSLAPGFADMPFTAQRAAVESIKSGGTTKDAYKAAAASIPGAIISMEAPNVAGQIAGKAVGTAASRLIRWPAKAAAGSVASVAALPVTTAIENTGRPADQQQPLIPTMQEAENAAASGGLFGVGAEGAKEAKAKVEPTVTPKAGATPAGPDLTRSDIPAEEEVPPHRIKTPAEIKEFAKDRSDQLNKVASDGVTTKNVDGVVTVEGRHLTDAEKAERDFLDKNKDDHEAVAKEYGLQVKPEVTDVEGAKHPDIQDQDEPVKVVPVDETPEPAAEKPVKPRIKLKADWTPITPDEHVVAAKSTGDHRDDVPEDAVARGVHLAETDPDKAQELVNEHRSNAALDAASEHQLGAGATEESAQAKSGNAGQRGAGTSSRDEAAGSGRQSGSAEGEVGGEANGAKEGRGRVPAVADRQPAAGGLEGTWVASDGKTILGGNPPEGTPEPASLPPHPRVNRENHVGLVGGIDRDDPNLVHIDSRMPHFEWMPDHDGPDGHSDGHWQNVDDEIVKHEDDENKTRQNINEKGYPTAHNEDGNAGTREHLAGDNTDSTVYSNVTRPYAERIHENTDPRKTPLTLDQRPYMPEHNGGKDDNTHLLHPDAKPQHVDEAPPRPGDTDANGERKQQEDDQQEHQARNEERPSATAGNRDESAQRGQGKAAEQPQGKSQEVKFGPEDLARRLSRPGAPVTVEVKPPPDNKSRALAAAVKRIFKRDVVFVKVNGDTGFNGAHIGGKKLYVSVDADKPYAHIIGHELLHSLRDTDPATYKKLVGAVGKVISGKTSSDFKRFLQDQYERQGLNQITDDKQHEEMLADLVGDHFTDPKFITGLKKSLEPNLARKVLAHVDSALEKFRRTVTGTPQEMGLQTRTMVENIDAARTAVKSALADLAKSEKEGAAKPDILFKRKEKPDVHSIPINFLSRINVNVPTMIDGEIQNRKVNARTAIKDFDSEIGAFKSLLDCLRS